MYEVVFVEACFGYINGSYTRGTRTYGQYSQISFFLISHEYFIQYCTSTY